MLTAAPWMASIECILLKNLLIMGELEEVAPKATIDTLTNEHMQGYISSIVTQPSGEYDPETIKRFLTGFKMPLQISSPEARIVYFASDLYEKIDSVGCGNFPTDKPKKTISIILSRL